MSTAPEGASEAAGGPARGDPLGWFVATVFPLAALSALLVAVVWTEYGPGGRSLGMTVRIALGVGAGAWFTRRTRRTAPLDRSRPLGDGALLVALLVGNGLRVAWWFLAPSRPVSDFLQYDNLAIGLATQGRFDGSALRMGAWFFPAYHEGPTAFRMPGYPLLLAAGYRLLGVNGWWGYALNCLLASGVVVAAWAMLRRSCSRAVAFGAILFLAAYPDLVYATSLHGTDLAGAAALLISAALLALAIEGRRRAPFLLLSGAALAFAIHCRPFLYVAVPFWLWLPLRQRSWGGRRRVLGAVHLGLGVAALLVPWAVRNAVVMGQAIWTHTSGWHYTMVMNNTDVDPRATSPASCLPLSEARDPACRALYGDSEVEMTRVGRRLGTEWIRAHPREFLERGVLRLRTAFLEGAGPLLWAGYHPAEPEPVDRLGLEARHLAVRVGNAGYGFLLGAALVGLWRTRRLAPSSPGGAHGEVAAILSGVVLGVVALAVLVFEGQARYHLPVVPLLTVATAIRLASSRSHGSRATPASAGVDP